MRAFYRGYHAATGRRAAQVRRLHVMREDGKFAGKQALCGAAGWGHTHSPPVVIEPIPATPPDGLSWCRSCVGHAADLVGMLDRFATTVADLAKKDHQRKCGRCRQTRPLFAFSYVPSGWMEFVEIDLCARCHSTSTVEDENDQLDQSVFVFEPRSSFVAEERAS